MTTATDRSCLTIILAAGEGRRMASNLPKVLHPVAGLPMVCHVLDTATQAGGTKHAVVVGNQAERVESVVKAHNGHTDTYVQNERKGTAHAVLAVRDAISEDVDDIVVLNGDVPLIKAETVLAARTALAEGADIVVLGFETADPTGYGRMIVQDGQLQAIREHKDSSPEELKITFCNSGIMAFRRSIIIETLEAIDNKNIQQEYYLTDVVEIGRARGLNVVAIGVPEEDTLGINDRVQLAEVESIWQQRQRNALLLFGVTMVSPDTVHFHHDTAVERDVVLEPNIVFGPGVSVRTGATIRAFSHLEGAEIGENAIVGPYARLRPGTELAAGAKIGNFVETKAAKVGKGAKINHLSYVGDAVVGEKANIGAGSVTCNYDGFNKYKTTIGDGAFIGTNTSLVAPVTIGTNANTAAGSVIYSDVPDNDLAIERSKQVNLPGRAEKLRQRNAEIKERNSK